MVGGQDDILRGPAGALGYLLFIPLYWWNPRRWTTGFLVTTSLLWALLTLGPAYVAWLALLVGGGWLALRAATRPSVETASRPAGPWRTVLMLLAIAYTLLLLWPQPLLPPVQQPLYFYLQWAGIGYIFLKLYHLVLDVSHGRLARPSPGTYAAYLLFAPTLRMGPIYRAGDFTEQLANRPACFQPADLPPAFGRILLGLIRWGAVMVLRERFPAEAVFGRPETLVGWELIAGIYAWPTAIFLWISGYADIAVGLGRLMGFRVPENFNYPWVATGLRDFWRRWHMTLGAWLRDFLYIPLGGNRRHVFVNFLITFGFCGLWHGLYPSYFAWGLSQAIGLYINRRWNEYWQGHRDRQSACYRWLRRWRLIDT
ncbi:MAG: hypothetical protein JXA69_18480, partial [Phycisphaerae bacterium]|nr:hypothetical protein [Phycisphaerae bacterium]